MSILLVYPRFTRLAKSMLALLVLVLVATAIQRVNAQTDFSQFCTPSNTLVYGDQDRSDVTSESVYQIYCFNGNQSDRIIIRVDTLDGTLDPLIALVNPQEKDQQAALISEDDDSGDGVNSMLEVELPYTGAYVIIVTRYGTQNGDTEGTFEIMLETANVALEATEAAVIEASGGKEGVATAESTTNETEEAVVTSAPSVTATQSPQDRIVGDWLYDNPSLGLAYHFNEDGTFTQVLIMFGGNIECPGTYSIRGDMLSVDFGFVLDMRPGGCSMGPDYATIQFNGQDEFTLISSDGGFTGQSLGLGTYQRQ